MRRSGNTCLYRSFCLVVLFILSRVPLLTAQQQISPEYQVKAVFLYNFTQFAEWPEYTFQSPASPLVIGVVGNDPFGLYLDETVAGETYKGRGIVIKRYRSLKEASGAHLLYISANAISKQALKQMPEKNILTVGDDQDLIENGGMIRLYKRNNRIRLQINLDAVKRSGVTISSKLLSLADITKG